MLTILRQANEFRKGFSRKGKKTELKGLGLVVYSSSVAFFVCVKKSLAFFQTVSSLKEKNDLKKFLVYLEVNKYCTSGSI